MAVACRHERPFFSAYLLRVDDREVGLGAATDAARSIGTRRSADSDDRHALVQPRGGDLQDPAGLVVDVALPSVHDPLVARRDEVDVVECVLHGCKVGFGKPLPFQFVLVKAGKWSHRTRLVLRA